MPNTEPRKTLSGTFLTLALFAVPLLAQGTPAAHYATSFVDRTEYVFAHSDMLFTHDGHNRGFGAQHDPARDNIVALFNSFGLQTELHPFDYSGSTYFNVVAELPGTTRPDEIYIVGAHFDSVNNPGADDNASGTAAVIELARLISQWESEATIRFIAFDREEQGLIGSEAYAIEHSLDDIRGMVSADMIAYQSTGYAARVYGRTASNSVKQPLAAAVAEYGGLSVGILGQLDASDHAPFEWEGFAAALLIEEEVWSNPHYHRQTDSVDTPNYIDYDYAVEMTRGLMGWLVEAAGVHPDYPLADMNGSYTVDAFDIEPFIMALTDPGTYALRYPQMDPMAVGDINGDGALDAFDIEGFIGLLTP
jgi:hypothetical protein